jgi:hypothetical protein
MRAGQCSITPRSRTVCTAENLVEIRDRFHPRPAQVITSQIYGFN